MEIKQAFGIVLRDTRIKAGISQEKLAFDCNLDRTFISMLERGKRRPTLDTIFKISKSLDTTPSKIIAEVETILDNNK
ncbi:MAG: helix-turn-helix transcriptional regulator [Bacteroidales bacterium]|nr:helix-turn-helix transcriptional regulator [Bacteroidales bacterium]